MTTARTVRQGVNPATATSTAAIATRLSVVILATTETLLRSVSRILARVPFDVHAARSPAECLAAARRESPDLLVIECQGWPALPEFLAELRDTLCTPVVLTGPDVAQGLDALRAGLSADFVRSPVWEHELRARAVRSARSGATAGIRRFGDLEIDSVARSVRLAGVAVALSAREFDLLEFLAAHAGTPFSREDLLEQVWKSSTDWQRPATVTEHVFRLRRKLGDDPADSQWIRTVPRAGYRFDAKSGGPRATSRWSGE